MADGDGCKARLPLATTLQVFKFLTTLCPTEDCRQNYNFEALFLGNFYNNLTCSLVLTTSRGQVTVVPAAPASLQNQ
jgi:hypothetical protein